MDSKSTPARSKNRTHIFTSFVETLETRQLLSTTAIATPAITLSPLASTGSVDGYSPAQIRHAYGFDQLSLDGSGQTIAIIDAYNDPSISADLKTFDSQFGLAAANLSIVSQSGSTTKLPKTDAGWASEIALDVEWAHAIAPGAKILLVETNSDSLTDLVAGVKYARSVSGVAAVSMSWGSDEYRGETAYDSTFTTPTGHDGITFLAASGDEGSQWGASWPSVSSNVISVGGTTLNLSDSAGTYSSETAWSYSSGGFSSYEAAPTYQSIVQNGSTKSAPDVSYDANPNTGFAVYDSVPLDGDSGWQVYGGTSAGTPQWAGLIALADQSRNAKGLSDLNGAAQALPILYSLYTSANYTSSYNDITSGGTSGGGGRFGRRGGNSAQSGYDLVTGLGSPKAAAIVAALQSATTPTIKAPTSNATARASFARASRADVVAMRGQQAPEMTTAIAPAEQANVAEQIINATAARTTISTATHGGESFAIGTDNAATSGAGGTFRSGNAIIVELHEVAPIVSHRMFAITAQSVSDKLSETTAAIAGNLRTIQTPIAELGQSIAALTPEAKQLGSWKEFAVLVGAGIAVGSYLAQQRKEKRVTG